MGVAPLGTRGAWPPSVFYYESVVILVPVEARAQNSLLGPGAVLVLIVLSIAVCLGSSIFASDARFVAW